MHVGNLLPARGWCCATTMPCSHARGIRNRIAQHFMKLVKHNGLDALAATDDLKRIAHRSSAACMCSRTASGRTPRADSPDMHSACSAAALASPQSLYIITATGDKRMDELTARQAEVLQLIADFLQGTGFPPTRAEIAQQLGFRSANAAEEHLRALERKGYIEMLPGASRGIRL